MHIIKLMAFSLFVILPFSIFGQPVTSMATYSTEEYSNSIQVEAKYLTLFNQILDEVDKIISERVDSFPIKKINQIIEVNSAFLKAFGITIDTLESHQPREIHELIINSLVSQINNSALQKVNRANRLIEKSEERIKKNDSVLKEMRREINSYYSDIKRNSFSISSRVIYIEKRLTRLESDVGFLLAQRYEGSYTDPVSFISATVGGLIDEGSLSAQYSLQYEVYQGVNSDSTIQDASLFLELGAFDWAKDVSFMALPNTDDILYEEDNSFTYLGIGRKYNLYARDEFHWNVGGMVGHSISGEEDTFLLNLFSDIGYFKGNNAFYFQAGLIRFQSIIEEQREFISNGNTIINRSKNSETVPQVSFKVSVKF